MEYVHAGPSMRRAISSAWSRIMKEGDSMDLQMYIKIRADLLQNFENSITEEGWLEREVYLKEDKYVGYQVNKRTNSQHCFFATAMTRKCAA